MYILLDKEVKKFIFLSKKKIKLQKEKFVDVRSGIKRRNLSTLVYGVASLTVVI